MIRLLKFLWTGQWKVCEHKWKIIEKIDMSSIGTRETWKKYVQQCETCGEMKYFETR